MAKRYRVQQRDQFGWLVYEKFYRVRAFAVFMAWAVAGQGFGGASYTSTMEEVDA